MQHYERSFVVLKLPIRGRKAPRRAPATVCVCLLQRALEGLRGHGRSRSAAGPLLPTPCTAAHRLRRWGRRGVVVVTPVAERERGGGAHREGVLDAACIG